MEQLLSVIVPVYNGEKTISRCVKSILASTFQNLEVLVVNDGSTDGTASVVEAIAEKDPRVILISTENGGVAKARNTGLARAKGCFIGFVDADDFISPDMYQTMADAMGEDCDMVICGSYHCDGDGNVTDRNPANLKGYRKNCPKEALDSVIYEHTTMAVWSKLFRSSRIKKEDGTLALSFRQDLVNYEDLVFVSEYVSRCSGYIELIPFRLYYYCFSQGSLSGKTVPPENLKTGLTYLTDLCGRFPEGSLSAPKLFYLETFLKYWYIQVIRHREYKKLRDIPENRLLLEEIRRYYSLYKSAPNVAFYKKLTAAVLTAHPALTFFLVKTVRRFVKL